MIDRAEVGVGAVPLEEAILPLHHHAEVLVVEQEHFHRDVLGLAGGQLLDVHQDAAVAIDVDHERVGTGHLRPHRRRQAEAHRAEAARGEPRSRPAEGVELGGPHLVLAHADGNHRVLLGREPRECLDGLLGKDARIRRVEGIRILFLPLGDPRVPRGEIGRRRLDDRVELAERGLDVRHDRHVDEFVLVDLGRVDVDVDDEPVLGEGLDLARDTVVEPHAHGDQEVGLVDRVVGVDAAVHAEHVERERVVAGVGPEPHQGHGDGDAGLPGERAEILGGIRGDHAAAGVDHRPLGPLDGGGDLLDLLGGRGLPLLGLVARQVHLDLIVGHDLRELDVFGQVDEHRPGAAGRGDVKRLLHHAGDVVGVGDQVVVLGDAAADLHHRGLLERVGADHAGPHLAREHDHRNAVELGVGDGRDEVEGPRAARAHAHARAASGAGVALGGEGAPLLVPREDGADLVLVAGERLVKRHARPARVGKDHVDPVPDQRLNDHVGPGDEGFGCFRRAGGGGHERVSWIWRTGRNANKRALNHTR